MATLNQTQIKTFLRYDPDTGIFVKLLFVGCKRKEIGWGVVGSKNTTGYVAITIDKKKYYAHRLAWLYTHGEWPTHHIDHINGDRTDNRINNLRQATNAENMQNIKGPRSDNKFGMLGVCYDNQRKKFLAQIRTKGKNRFIGRFDDPNLAHEAYMKAKREVHEFNTI